MQLYNPWAWVISHRGCCKEITTLPGWQMHPHCYWPLPIDSFAYSTTSVSMAGAVDGVLVCIQTRICILPQLWYCCSWCTQPVAYHGYRALMALACCSGSTWSLRIRPSPPDILYSWAGFHLPLTWGRGAPGLIPCTGLTWGPGPSSSRWISWNGLTWAIWQCTWRPHGAEKTYVALKKNVWWPRMKAKVEKYIAACPIY